MCIPGNIHYKKAHFANHKMLSALRLLNERLNATLGAEEIPSGPQWGGSTAPQAGSSEHSAKDDAITPYDARDGFFGPWTPADNSELSKFNTLITEDYPVMLGELIKFNDQMLQVCRVMENENGLKVFDCRRFELHSAIIRIAPTTQNIYSSQPSTIRNYLPFGQGEAMESLTRPRSYRPRQHN